MARAKTHIALFGNVKMLRGWCDACDGSALIRSGKFLCCGAPLSDEPTAVKRVVQPEQTRRLPSLRDREAVMQAQEHRCAYCLRPFGSFYWRHGKAKQLRVHWDHVVPFSWSQDNGAYNFVAACHVCNSLKGDKLFPTFEEARVYLTGRWIELYDKGDDGEEESA